MVEIIAPKKPDAIDFIKPVRIGEIIEGAVTGVGRSALYLDVGPQGTGVIYGREFLDEKSRLRQIHMGDKLSVKVIDLENENGFIELSLKEASRELSWKKLQDAKSSDELIPVKIVGANKGGLLAEISGTPAFLPVSQLSQEHYPKVEGGDPGKILKELQKFMGKELQVQILDLDLRERKIILSEKSKEKQKLKEMLSKYKVGDVVEGEVTGIVEFGAFMKFSGENQEPIEGLIHISEIDWQIIEDPSQFLKIGEKVQAEIIDLTNGRVSLSIKALKDDPWKDIETKYPKLSQIQGKVTKLNPFGAFIEIEAKIQGLCHISEFGTKENMDKSLVAGDTYPFQILEINPVEHRMSLRLVKPGEETPKPAPEPTPEPAPEASPETK